MMDWNLIGDFELLDLFLSVIYNYWIYLNLYLVDYGKEIFNEIFLLYFSRIYVRIV